MMRVWIVIIRSPKSKSSFITGVYSNQTLAEKAKKEAEQELLEGEEATLEQWPVDGEPLVTRESYYNF